MKRRFIHTLPIILFSIFAVSISYAQDASSLADDTYEASSHEKINYSPGGESDPIVTSPKSQAVAVKDTANGYQHIRTSPTSEPSKGTKQATEDDSVLSFNFLYYIIRKYKLQDIID